VFHVQIDELAEQIDRMKLETSQQNSRRQELERQLHEAKAQLDGESATADKYKEYVSDCRPSTPSFSSCPLR
jgi:chromosome segregation ATPase